MIVYVLMSDSSDNQIINRLTVKTPTEPPDRTWMLNRQQFTTLDDFWEL